MNKTLHTYLLRSMWSISIVLMVTILLTGCETWLEYNGKIDDPKLCINAEIQAGEPMMIYLTRSWFFTDKDRYKNGKYGATDPGYMEFAEVEVQVNGGEWEKLKYLGKEADTNPEMMYSFTGDDGISHNILVQHGYVSTHIPRPGDTLSIRASADNYKPVSATEVVPQPLTIEVGKAYIKDNVAFFTLNTQASKGNPDDVVFLSITTHGYGYRVDTIYQRGGFQRTATDSLIITKMVFSMSNIFSADPAFGEYGMKQDDYGYYSHNTWLYTSAEHFTKSGSLTLLQDDYYWYNSSASLQHVDVDTIRTNEFDYALFSNPIRPQNGLYITGGCTITDAEISARVVSRSLYFYRSSLDELGRRYYRTLSLHDPSKPAGHWDENGNYVDDSSSASGNYTDFGDITDMIDELGIMEDKPIYSNIKDGLGHFSTFTTDTIKIEF